MKTSSLPPKSAAKAGSETRTAFAAACALYLPCLTLAVWGASLVPAPASVGAEGIMLAVAQFESAAAEPEPKQAAESELKPEPEPQPEPDPNLSLNLNRNLSRPFLRPNPFPNPLRSSSP